ncbi:MAG: hypothetical protein ACRC54_02045 [Fusobacteriaceae bacterium]
MSGNFRPYSEGINSFKNIVNCNTGTITSKIELTKISSGLELPASFSFEIYVGAVNIFPNSYQSENRGYILSLPRIIIGLVSIPNQIYLNGKVENLYLYRSTHIREEYRMKYNKVENIRIYRYLNATDFLKNWCEVIYEDGTVDIFNSEGEIETRISPAGHKLKFSTFALSKYESLLTRVEDEYGHSSIDIEYSSSTLENQTIRIITSIGEGQKTLTEIALKVRKNGNIKTVESIKKFGTKTRTEAKVWINYNYIRLEDGNYYIENIVDSVGETLKLSYGKLEVTYENKKIYAIIKTALIMPTLRNSVKEVYYKYSKNNYTGYGGKGWVNREYSDNAMEMDDEDYRYIVAEVHIEKDSDYPDNNTEIFAIKRTFNKYHLLLEEIHGFAKDIYINMWEKKIKSVEYEYGEMQAGFGKKIENQPSNFSFWTNKKTFFIKKDNPEIVEEENQITLVNGNVFSKIDEKGIKRVFTYELDVIPTNLLKSIITYPLKTDKNTYSDIYNKIEITYEKINGKQYKDSSRQIQISPQLFLPQKVMVHSSTADTGLLKESNKYINETPTREEDWFFFGAKTESIINGDEKIGNYLSEKSEYSYFDEGKSLLLMKVYNAKKEKSADVEVNSKIKCSIISIVTELPKEEWYQLSLASTNKTEVIKYEYDEYHQLSRKISPIGTESYEYYNEMQRDIYEKEDPDLYIRHDSIDIFGCKKINYLNSNKKVVKVYGSLPGKSELILLGKNKYMVNDYLMENIEYDYYISPDTKIKTVFESINKNEYKEFRLYKATYPDKIFETYNLDEYAKRETIKKNNYITKITEFNFQGKVLKEIIMQDKIENELLVNEYDEYGNLVKMIKFDGSNEMYFYDNFKRLKEKRIDPIGGGINAFKELLIYPLTALNCDKVARITIPEGADWFSTREYSSYGEVLSEDGNNYEYNEVEENQVKRFYNGVGEINYTYYPENELLKTMEYTQKNKEELFKTIYDELIYSEKRNLKSYRIKNFENNIEKHCSKISYGYTNLGTEDEVKLNVKLKSGEFKEISSIKRAYTDYENRIITLNYNHINCIINNKYNLSNGNLEKSTYSFGDSFIEFNTHYLIDYNGKLEGIGIKSNNLFINNFIEFTYDEQEREMRRVYGEKKWENDFFVTKTEYTVDSKIKNRSFERYSEVKNESFTYNKNGTLLETVKNFTNFNLEESEKIISDSPEIIRGIDTKYGILKESEFFSYKKDCLELYEKTVEGKKVEKLVIKRDASGNLLNDSENIKIIYNAENQAMRIKKKDSLVEYNYYYYMTGELMCVSEVKENPRKIYYIYDNGENIGELIYENEELKLSTLYVDIAGIRVGRYIKDIERNREFFEMHCSDVSGTVHRVYTYEKNVGVMYSEKNEYTIYGELEAQKYSTNQYLGTGKHMSMETSGGVKIGIEGLLNVNRKI